MPSLGSSLHDGLSQIAFVILLAIQPVLDFHRRGNISFNPDLGRCGGSVSNHGTTEQFGCLEHRFVGQDISKKNVWWQKRWVLGFPLEYRVFGAVAWVLIST